MKKILVPIDFSEISTHATKFAIDLAEKNDAEVTLLNSIHFDYYADYQFGSFAAIGSLIEDLESAVNDKMDKFINQFSFSKSLKKEISNTSLVSSIKEMVTNHGYDLVVIGTNGTSGLEEVMVGSNTEKIVRHAPCPVISVPVACTMNSIQKILVPIDIREIRHKFFDRIVSLQQQFDAHLDFLWVKTPHNVENEDVLSDELVKVIKGHDISKFNFTIVNNVFPSDGIIIQANDIQADMIAMPTHARRGIAHWLSGSLTEDTVNHIDIPVWSFKIHKDEAVIKLNGIKNVNEKPDYKKLVF